MSFTIRRLRVSIKRLGFNGGWVLDFGMCIGRREVMFTLGFFSVRMSLRGRVA